MSPQMKKRLIYVEAPVVGGCEDAEFTEDSLALERLSEGANGQ
jgi:hypothetical protein